MVKIYNNPDEFNAATGACASPQGGFGGRELDLGYRLPGPDQPGGRDGGWLLVTGFPESSNESVFGTKEDQAWLYAYEIDVKNCKTGRIALIRENWSEKLDEQFYPKFRQANAHSISDHGRDLSLDEVEQLTRQVAE